MQKTIKVNEKEWKELLKLRIDMGHKNMSETINFILKKRKGGKNETKS